MTTSERITAIIADHAIDFQGIPHDWAGSAPAYLAQLVLEALAALDTERDAVGYVVLVTKAGGVQYAVNDFPARLSNCRAVVARKRDSEHTYTIHPVGPALSPVEPEEGA